MQMSITRALSEIKLLDKKIDRGIQSSEFAQITVGRKGVKGYKTTEEFEQYASSQYQSVTALIARRRAIKSAIVQSNAITDIVIGGEKMTVAEAIERKSSILFEQQLLHKLKMDFHQANNRAETENARVKQQLDRMLESNFGKDSKVKDTDVELISKPYLEQNEAKVVDPLDARKEIEKLEVNIEEFLTEVDHVLSESNTITKIEIPE